MGWSSPTSKGIDDDTEDDVGPEQCNDDEPKVNICKNEEEPRSVVGSVALRNQGVTNATSISDTLDRS